MVYHTILEAKEGWQYECCHTQKHKRTHQNEDTLCKAILTSLQLDVDIGGTIQAEQGGYGIHELCHIRAHRKHIGHHVIEPSCVPTIVGSSTSGLSQNGNTQQKAGRR